MEKIGAIAKNYYDFFANFRCTPPFRPAFLENGWFVCVRYRDFDSGYVTEIYDEEAKLRQEIPETSFIYVLSKVNIIVKKGFDQKLLIYHKDKLIKTICCKDGDCKSIKVIDDCALSYKTESASFVLVAKASFDTETMSYNDDNLELKVMKLGKTAEVLSADGLGLIAYKYAKGNETIRILNFDGQNKELLYCVQNVKFLRGCRAIINSQRHILISYDNFDFSSSYRISLEFIEKFPYKTNYPKDTILDCFLHPVILLDTPEENGLKPLGDNAIIFENALIADARSGKFLDEYSPSSNLLYVDYDENDEIKPIYVESNVIRFADKKAFYPRKNCTCYKVLGKTLIVFMMRDECYPVFLKSDAHRYWDKDEMMKNPIYCKTFEQALVF